MAFLALQSRPVQRMYVAGTLWADSSNSHAAANLRSSLWRLRRKGRTFVDAMGTRLTLAPAIEVDVRDVEQRARDLLRWNDPTRPPSTSFDFDANGGLLPDWQEDWVIVERERFRQLHLHALERSCAELARLGFFAEAIEAGLAAVTEEPLHESAHRVLIQAYLAEGNRADALRQYAHYTRIMRDDLQLEPSADVRSLVAGLHDPAFAG
jgi:DNA-binding SARP family transcriptional activator